MKKNSSTKRPATKKRPGKTGAKAAVSQSLEPAPVPADSSLPAVSLDNGANQLDVHETTADLLHDLPDPDDYEPKLSPWQVELAEMFQKARDSYHAAKDPQLWTKDVTKPRPLSDSILEPIREALRAQGFTRVNAQTSPGVPMQDEAMRTLFGEGLEALEQLLGRFVLDAIITGDRSFKERIDDAVKDADLLFHRGRSPGGLINEAFFRWWHNLAEGDRAEMTVGKVKKAVAKQLGRAKELSPSEWANLKREQPELQTVPKGRSGRPTKRRE